MKRNNWSISDAAPQTGKVAIITGANAGLGYYTAEKLAMLGAEVVMAARNREKAESAIRDIKQLHPGARLSFIPLNLSSLASVRAFVNSFSQQFDRLDLLVNNAGIMVPPYSKTEDGFESQLGTNYLGHFLLTGLLMPLLLKSNQARVVSLSSLMHKYGRINFNDLQSEKGYNKIAAYGQSKLACLMYSYELQRKLVAAKLPIVSVASHPGVSSTLLGRNMSPVLRYLFPRFGQSAEAGALPTLRAALDPEVRGGEYYGPDGFHELRGRPVRVTSSKRSRNEAAAARLWKVSEELTGFTYDLNIR